MSDPTWTAKMFDENKALKAKVKELEAEVDYLVEGHNQFNRAIAHAFKLSAYDTYAFLHFWNEGDWEACRDYDFEYEQDDEE